VTLLPPFGTLAGEVTRAGLVGLAFAALFVAAEAWRRVAQPPVEGARQRVHGGIVVGFFPWLFASSWTVLALALLATAALGGGRRLALLPSVTGVARKSRGEILFPLAGCLLFVLAHDRPIFYVIALYTLVVSDTLAALLGRAYGRMAFAVGEDRKSVEGSAAFFTATFVGVHLMLLLGTSLERLATVLIAAQIALLVTSVEAITGRGDDNLVVPLASFYLLVKMAPKTAAGVGVQLLAQLGILAFVLVLAWRTRFLTLSGAIAAHLVLYAAFSLGGPHWVVGPVGALAGFLALDARYDGLQGLPRGGYQVRAIYWVSIVAVLCIFADNSFATLIPAHPGLGSGQLFYPLFLGALAAPVAIFAFEAREDHPDMSREGPGRRALVAYAVGAGAVLPLGLGAFGARITAEAATIALLSGTLGLALYLALRGRITLADGAQGSLRLAALATLVATLLTLSVHLRWVGVPAWGPTS
jgi:hypothetical protein